MATGVGRRVSGRSFPAKPLAATWCSPLSPPRANLGGTKLVFLRSCFRRRHSHVASRAFQCPWHREFATPLARSVFFAGSGRFLCAAAPSDNLGGLSWSSPCLFLFPVGCQGWIAIVQIIQDLGKSVSQRPGASMQILAASSTICGRFQK